VGYSALRRSEENTFALPKKTAEEEDPATPLSPRVSDRQAPVCFFFFSDLVLVLISVRSWFWFGGFLPIARLCSFSHEQEREPLTRKPSHNPMSHNPMSHNPMSHNPMSHNPMSHNPMSHNPMAADGQDASTEEPSLQSRPSKRFPRAQPGTGATNPNAPNSRDPNHPNGATVPAPRRRNPTETEPPERFPIRESSFKSPVSPRAVPSAWAKNKEAKGDANSSPTALVTPSLPALPLFPPKLTTSTDSDMAPSPRDAASDSLSARDVPSSPHRTASPRGNGDRERLERERERIDRERREERERERENAGAKPVEPEPEDPVDTFENYKMVSCGLCKLTFEECDTVIIKEVSRSFCHKCSNDVIERAKLKGLTLTKV
jgi:hypothetical protein